MAGLLEGWDWFDNALQAQLKSGGFEGYNKSQSMMIMYVSSGVRRPAEIARKMRLSRQAIGHIAGQLLDMKVLEANPDADDGRSVVLGFSPRARSLQTTAQKIIATLEDRLEQRIGARKMAALIEILNIDWGAAIDDGDLAATKKSRAGKS
ncbi:hypothetical protein sos41_07480 [Alphaproteobacteria bacterium SO-S41]|nr:hypothetical protein sos41_07480 [Alphaproteobacteria bacterium SO-S41]